MNVGNEKTNIKENDEKRLSTGRRKKREWIMSGLRNREKKIKRNININFTMKA